VANPVICHYKYFKQPLNFFPSSWTSLLCFQSIYWYDVHSNVSIETHDLHAKHLLLSPSIQKGNFHVIHKHVNNCVFVSSILRISHYHVTLSFPNTMSLHPYVFKFHYFLYYLNMFWYAIDLHMMFLKLKSPNKPTTTTTKMSYHHQPIPPL
jgi:hypothetical protein